MQNIILLFILSLISTMSLASATPATANERELSFRYKRWEKSKDSNSHEYQIDILQNKVTRNKRLLSYKKRACETVRL